ncbi:MAG: hypothetical protein GC191_12725 [Azospirillum sp.]|nr:hypothetical protein [Azospirillum sp.]
MLDRLAIDLFVEDQAHEKFLNSLIRRIAVEASQSVVVRTVSARGGHSRVFSELKRYQALLQRGALELPDLLVAAIDANCKGFVEARKLIIDALGVEWRERTAIACPDPHVERRFLADLESFHKVVGFTPSLKRAKCEQDYYKCVLAQAVRDGGHLSLLGGIEFADELVTAMDLQRAQRSTPSLGHFIEDFRALLKRWWAPRLRRACLRFKYPPEFSGMHRS